MEVDSDFMWKHVLRIVRNGLELKQLMMKLWSKTANAFKYPDSKTKGRAP